MSTIASDVSKGRSAPETKSASEKWIIHHLTSIPSDTRQYRYLISQETGLKVLLIHKANLTNSEAFVEIAAGSNHEPKHCLGLAHAVEHMVFSGTEEFEGNFTSHISKHGGEYDGNTQAEKTQFQFSIPECDFPFTLKLFSQFFTCPSFKKDKFAGELNAMNIEFNGNLSDSLCVEHVEKELINPLHPEKRFNWGTADTLADVDVVLKEMRMFHETYYKANNMFVVLTSSLSLDVLQKHVEETFLKVKKSQHPIPKLPEIDKYTPKEKGIIIQQSIQNNNVLSSAFVFHGKDDLSFRHAISYIKSLFNSPHESSLLELLKREDLIEDDVNDIIDVEYHANNQVEFQIAVDLTEKGKKAKYEIVLRFLEFVAFLKKVGFQKDYFNYCKKIEQDLLKSHGPFINTAEQFIENIQKYPLERFFAGHLMLDASAPVELIAEILNSLTIENMHCIYCILDDEVDLKEYREEQYTKAKYKILVNSIEDILKTIPELHPWKFSVPTFGDRFIPQHDKPEDFSEKYRLPRLVYNHDLLRVLCSQDLIFKKPSVITNIIFVTQLTRCSPINAILMEIFINIVVTKISTKFSLDFTMAQCDASLSSTDRGMKLYVKSFSESHERLVLAICNFVSSYQIEEHFFGPVVRRLKKKYTSNATENISEQASSKLEDLINVYSYTDQEKLQALSQVDLKMLKEWWENVINDSTFDFYSHGNTSAHTATRLAQKVLDTFIHQRISSKKTIKTTPDSLIVQLPQNTPLFYSFQSEAEITSNALLYYLQAPNNTRKTGLLCHMLQKKMETDFMETFRTKLAIAYTPICIYSSFVGYSAITLVLESPLSPVEMQKHIQTFLVDFIALLSKMSETDFKILKQTLNKSYAASLDHPQSPDNVMNFFLGQFVLGNFDFEYLLDDKSPYNNCSFGEFIAFATEMLCSKTRREISIVGLGKPDVEEGLSEEENSIDKEEETDPESFAADASDSQDISYPVADDTTPLAPLVYSPPANSKATTIVSERSSSMREPNSLAQLQGQIITNIAQFKKQSKYFPCQIAHFTARFHQKYSKTEYPLINPLLIYTRIPYFARDTINDFVGQTGEALVFSFDHQRSSSEKSQANQDGASWQHSSRGHQTKTEL